MRESKYIDETPLNHRKDYGQFFTPPPVARLMAEWVMKDNPEKDTRPCIWFRCFL